MNKRTIKDISDFIFVSDKPKKADIIMLPGGSLPDIPEYAAGLYKAGYADKIIPAGKYSVKNGKFKGVREKKDIYNKEYMTECEFYFDVLVKNGVKIESIIPEDKSEFTRENAVFSKIILDELNIDVSTAIIVCKSFHARRCLMYYSLAFPNTEFLVCPVDGFGISKDNWYLSEYGVKRVLGEVARISNQFNNDFLEYLK